MHALWDGDVIRALGRDPEAVAGRILARAAVQKHESYQSGTAATWANESYRIAMTEIYAGGQSGTSDAPIILPAAYPSEHSGIVETQLEKAGVRLAWILNRALR